MKNAFVTFLLALGLIGSIASADAPAETIIGKLAGPVTGAVSFSNPEIALPFVSIRFVNTGTRDVLISHIRVNEPDAITHLGPEMYRLPAGASALHSFSNQAVFVESVEWLVHGNTESMVVYGVNQ